MCLDKLKWKVACSLTMTRTVGSFGKHLEHPVGNWSWGFLQFQHHSLLQWTLNFSCTLVLFFCVMKDFVDAGQSILSHFVQSLSLWSVITPLSVLWPAASLSYIICWRACTQFRLCPRALTRWKQGLQMRFECTCRTNVSSRIQVMLLIRSIHIFILKNCCFC